MYKCIWNIMIRIWERDMPLINIKRYCEGEWGRSEIMLEK